jgi:hypothetical protein
MTPALFTNTSNPAVTLVSVCDKGFDTVQVRHVQLLMERFAAGFLDVVGECGDPVRAPGAKNDLITVRRDVAGRGLANTAAGTRDQHDLARHW